MDFRLELAKRHADCRKKGNRFLPRIVCKDGFSMSVQVGEYNYCQPRRDLAAYYSEAEIWFPSEEEPLIMRYAENPSSPTETVYGYVPSELIYEVIEKHGGEKNE